jgi:hypothetical protein
LGSLRLLQSTQTTYSELCKQRRRLTQKDGDPQAAESGAANSASRDVWQDEATLVYLRTGVQPTEATYSELCSQRRRLTQSCATNRGDLLRVQVQPTEATYSELCNRRRRLTQSCAIDGGDLLRVVQSTEATYSELCNQRRRTQYDHWLGGTTRHIQFVHKMV